MKATKIRMQSGKETSNSVTEIESIYLTGDSTNGFACINIWLSV